MESVLRVFENIDWIAVILGSSLLILVLCKFFFYNRFISFVSLPFNNKYIFIYGKKDILFNWFNFLWSLFMGLNLSLFIFYFLDKFIPANTNYVILTYFTILGLLALFYVVKIVLQLVNGYVFNSEVIIEQYIFKKISYLNYSGLILFFANILLTYVVTKGTIILSIALILILVVNIIGWVNLLKNHRNFLANNFFYFILYLCALEISPLVIIVNYLKFNV